MSSNDYEEIIKEYLMEQIPLPGKCEIPGWSIFAVDRLYEKTDRMRTIIDEKKELYVPLFFSILTDLAAISKTILNKSSDQIILQIQEHIIRDHMEIFNKNPKIQALRKSSNYDGLMDPIELPPTVEEE